MRRAVEDVEELDDPTPSVVAFTKDGEVLVGETAKRQNVTNVDRTISSVKAFRAAFPTCIHTR